ncbi:MAG: DNA polymerase III subunit delta [Planctomycetes bacterium]|nr:DNA polymerase III subunit delta [Planctomycetota bacterium]
MATLSFSTFAASLGKQDLAPVYVLAGKEAWLRREAIGRILHRAYGSAQGGPGLWECSTRGTTPEAIIAAASTGSLFGDRRVVVLRDDGDLFARRQDDFFPLVESAARSKRLVLVVAPGASWRSNLRLAKKCAEVGAVVDCAPLEDAAAQEWVAARLRAAGLDAERSVPARLVENRGADLFALAGEVEKIAAFKNATPGGAPARVSAAEVDALLGPARAGEVWDLTSALVRRDARRALVLLARLLQGGMVVPQLTAAVFGDQRRLWTIKHMAGRGASDAEIAAAARTKPFVVGRLRPLANQVTFSRLQRNMEALLAAERLAKGSSLADHLVAERLVFDLCRA